MHPRTRDMGLLQESGREVMIICVERIGGEKVGNYIFSYLIIIDIQYYISFRCAA